MSISPTTFELRNMFETMQCEEVYKILHHYYERCIKRQQDYELTESEIYNDSLDDKQVGWLRELLASFPVGGRENNIQQILKGLPIEDLITKLRRFRLCDSDIYKIEGFFISQVVISKQNTSSRELENAAIQCGFISNCRLCAYAHITDERDNEGIQFRGCIENPRITREIYGECTLFIRRENDGA